MLGKGKDKMAILSKLDLLRMEAKAECEIRTLRDFELSLGKSPREAITIAVAVTQKRYPALKGSRIFRLAEDAK